MSLEFHFWNAWFYFMFVLLPIGIFAIDSWEKSKADEKNENKYHNLTPEERKQLANEQPMLEAVK